MGKMNLLKADYTGTVGETYGYRRKKTSVICANPFSHAPHNQMQKDSFTAFSAMQKFNGLVAREYFSFTGFDAKNKNKINVVAKELKGLIVDHQFKPEEIKNIIPNDNSFFLVEVSSVQQTGQISIKVSNSTLSKSPKVDHCFISAIGLDNVPIGTVSADLQNGEQVFTIENLERRPFYVIGFKSVWNGVKWHLADGIYYNNNPDVFNGVWYLDRLNSITPVTIANEVLSFNLVGARVENERLIINY